MRVHIGHSTMIGASCGYGSKNGDNDIVVSADTFFREIAKRHRCNYCTTSRYPHGGSPEADPSELDKED